MNLKQRGKHMLKLVPTGKKEPVTEATMKKFAKLFLPGAIRRRAESNLQEAVRLAREMTTDSAQRTIANHARADALGALEAAQKSDVWRAVNHAFLAGVYYREAIAHPWEEIAYKVHHPATGNTAKTSQKIAVVEQAIVDYAKTKTGSKLWVFADKRCTESGLRGFKSAEAFRKFRSVHELGKSVTRAP